MLVELEHRCYAMLTDLEEFLASPNDASLIVFLCLRKILVVYYSNTYLESECCWGVVMICAIFLIGCLLNFYNPGGGGGVWLNVSANFIALEI